MHAKLGRLLIALLLISCQPQPKEKADASIAANTVAPTPVAAAPTSAVVQPVPAKLAARLLYESLTALVDTVFRAGRQEYYLTMRVRLDTLQRLTHQIKQDTTSGYQGYYTFTVRDSLRQLVSQRTLRKQDFYQAVGPELAVLSNANLPTLLGYSAPLGGLVFSVSFGAPETDWISEAVLLLTLQGKVRRVVLDYTVGGPDVHATLAPDRQSLLTAEAIFRSHSAPLLLRRPGMELRGALLLNDSLAVAVFEPGTWLPRPGESPEWVTSPAQKRQPNAFILNTHSGQTVSSFRYDGFWEELGTTIPAEYMPATHTGYFLDDKKGLYLVSASSPRYVTFRPLNGLASFEPPARQSEKRLVLAGHSRHYQFYIDTLDAARIRCQYEQVALE